MTVAEFFGCVFISFGMPAAMFCFTICDSPIKVILLTFSMFLWLLAMLISSSIWFILNLITDFYFIAVILSVFIQEGSRYAMYKLLDKTSANLKDIAGDSLVVHNKPALAYVAGLGFGLIAGIFQSVNILADAYGPGTMGLKKGSETFFITSSVLTLCIILLHTFWSVIFFIGVQCNRKLVVYVVISHLLFSCVTFFNQYGMYSMTIAFSLLNVLTTMILAYITVGGNSEKFKKFLSCQQ